MSIPYYRIFKITIKTVSLAAVLILPSCRTAKTSAESGSNESLIIYYEPATGNKELLKAAERYGSEVLYVYRNFNGIAVTVPKGKNISDALKYYTGIKGVLSVTKDEKMQLD